MSLTRVLVAWVVVAVWLMGWQWVERASGRGRGRTLPSLGLRQLAGEALLVVLFGALWFVSLGAGAWWLPFLLVGALREWPIRSLRGATRVIRLVGAGGLLAWLLPV
jgi:hypothetical protein